jgi:hypothetical protein
MTTPMRALPRKSSRIYGEAVVKVTAVRLLGDEDPARFARPAGGLERGAQVIKGTIVGRPLAKFKICDRRLGDFRRDRKPVL